MEIVAELLEVVGTRGTLLPATSLRVRDRQVLLVAGEPGSGRTALALALSGRLRPTRGTVRCDGSTDARMLRRRTAVVDVSGVSEPDESARLRDVVAEGLSVAGRSAGQRQVRSWLLERGLHDHTQRFDALASGERARVLLDLAAEGDAAALVLDCPDRHGGDPRAWYVPAQRHAERGLAVIVLCSPRSAELLGIAYASVGHDNLSVSTVDSCGGPR